MEKKCYSVNEWYAEKHGTLKGECKECKKSLFWGDEPEDLICGFFCSDDCFHKWEARIDPDVVKIYQGIIQALEDEQ